MNPLRPYILPAVALLSLGSACALLSVPTHEVTFPTPEAVVTEAPHAAERTELQARWRTDALRQARALAQAELASSFNAPSTYAPENGAEQVAQEFAAFAVRRNALDEQVAALQAERREAEFQVMKATSGIVLESAWKRLNILDARIEAAREAYRRQGRDEAHDAALRLAQTESQLRALQLAAGPLDDACVSEWQGGRTRVC